MGPCYRRIGNYLRPPTQPGLGLSQIWGRFSFSHPVGIMSAYGTEGRGGIHAAMGTIMLSKAWGVHHTSARGHKHWHKRNAV